MNRPKETVLLFDLLKKECQLIRHLVASFEVEAVEVTIGSVRQFIGDHPDHQICLAVFRVGSSRTKQERIISLIRDFVGELVPILILVPDPRLGDLQKYLRAGADDFLELPMNIERFSIAFLILLEMGQAIIRQPPPARIPKPTDDPTRTPVWHRMLDVIQQGVSYFTPRSLMSPSMREPISHRWEWVRELGQGGFGVVWLIRDTNTRKLAVAKTPHSEQMNIRVLRSAAILKRLVHHPNIVHLMELVKSEGKFILIQEYIKGETLQQMLAHSITPLEKESCLLQLFSVISYAHKHRILHRDLKPENMIISESGTLKLLDFGIARDLSWQSGEGRSEGTVNFMPPEQFQGFSRIESDVWALGVIFYILATNAVPYAQTNDQYPQDIEGIVQSRAPSTINPSLPPQLDQIIMRCLKTAAEDRYPDATDLLHDLQASFPEFGRGRLLPPSQSG